MTSDGPRDQAWKDLGDLLMRRRIEIDPRYSNRSLFARENGAQLRILSAVELGERDTYEAGTISAIEVIYRLRPGAIRRFLAGEATGLEANERRARPPSPEAESPQIPVRDPLADIHDALRTGLDASAMTEASWIAEEIRNGTFEVSDGWTRGTEEAVMASDWDPEAKAKTIAGVRALVASYLREAAAGGVVERQRSA